MIIEAALHSTPSIGSDRGGIPEAIGNAGIVLPLTADPQTWADAIHATDHHTRGAQARQHAAEFTGPRLPTLEALGIYPRRRQPRPHRAGPSTSATAPRPR